MHEYGIYYADSLPPKLHNQRTSQRALHPQIIVDQPGACPICGMDLVPTSRYGYSSEPVEQPSSLYVPRSALLMAGKNSVVYVEVEPELLCHPFDEQ